MTAFQVGDRVRALGVSNVVLYEGTITHCRPIAKQQFCTIEIVEGSGIWSHLRVDTIFSRFLRKLDIVNKQ